MGKKKEELWLSRKRYLELKKRIAELEKQVEIQQLTLRMCEKTDLSARQLIEEYQPSGNSLSANTSDRTEETLQSIDSTLKRIEQLISKKVNVEVIMDGIVDSVTNATEQL